MVPPSGALSSSSVPPGCAMIQWAMESPSPLTSGAIDEFEAGFDAMLVDWERMIGEACTTSR